MMTEYIEREALMNWVKEFYPNDKHFLSGVINAPTADVAEVKHGKWIKITGMSPPEYHGKYVCSECGDKALCKNHREELSIYCPNCGAKMDKEYIQKPLAYVLFQVWEKADKQKRRAKMIDEITNEAAVACCPLRENEKCVGVGNCLEIKSYITTGRRKEMNTLEAIKQLDIIIGTEKVLIQHATMGEYQHSEKIKALEIAKKALEMQIPKYLIYKDYYSDDEGKWITDDAYCPNCNKHFDMFREFKSYYAKEYKCCPSCGQALDWSDT